MIPIEKNIIVVDENGTVFDPTWLKRANGLVKKGRARWLDEKTICLACPPERSEDSGMENCNRTETAAERAPGTEVPARTVSGPGGVTIEGLLDRMDAIRKEMIGMDQICASMENIAGRGGEDDAGHIAEAAARALTARETTCQQQLRFLEKIYDDHFSAPSEEAKTARVRMILDNMNGIVPSWVHSGENGNGGAEALRVLKELYGELMK